MFSLGVFILLLLRLVHSTEDQKNLDEIVNWFDENGFEPFKVMCILPNNEDDAIKYKVEIEELRENYCFLRRCLESKEEKFSAEEVVKLVKLADYYMAIDDKMTRVIEVFLEAVRESSEPLPNLKINPHFHEALQLYLEERIHFGIQLSYFEVKLNGWETSLDNKRFAQKLLRNLAPCYGKIKIENLMIDEENFTQVQELLSGHLSAVSFENCSFLQEDSKYLSFRNLPHLMKLQFSDSYFPNFIQMLKTVPKERLIELDISNNPFKREEIIELIPILSTMNQLLVLDLSFNFPFKWIRPKFTGNILKLSNPTSLNLSGNLNMCFFLNKLSKLEKNLSYEYLNLSNNGIGLCPKFNDEIFFSQLSKIPFLKKLDLSGMYFDKWITHPINIAALNPIEELSYDAYKGFVKFEEFSTDFSSKNIPMKITATCEWFRVTSIFEICLNKRIELMDIQIESTVIKQLPVEFDVIDLSFVSVKFSKETPQDSFEFLGRFKKLRNLRICLYDTTNFDHLVILLNSSRVDEIELFFKNDFTQFYNLLSLLSKHTIKIFKMKNEYTAKQNFDSYLQKLVLASFWSEMKVFECVFDNSQTAAFILQHAKLSKLHTISIKYCIACDKNITITLPSVRNVFLYYQLPSSSSPAPKNYFSLISAFPAVTKLELDSYGNLIVPFDRISALTNLRALKIHFKGIKNYDSFLQLASLPHLTQIIICEKVRNEEQTVVFGRHRNFPSLAFSWLRTDNEQMKELFAA